MFIVIASYLRMLRECFLDVLLPNRTKRLIVLASLTSKLEAKGALSVLTVDKVNDMFKLCSHKDALPGALHIGQVIWQDQPITDIVAQLGAVPAPSPDSLRPVVEKILSMIPSSLRWGNDDAIGKDLMDLLKFEKAHHA